MSNELNKMSCEDFAELLDSTSNQFSTLCDELHWEGGFKAEPFFNLLKKEAKKQNMELTNLESFNYDTYFHNIYKNTEKGLS